MGFFLSPPQGTIETEDILSCGAANKTDADGHPVFVVLCTDRVFKFVAADASDMDEWIRVLTPRRANGDSRDPSNDEILERGWMLKMGGTNNFKRRRWFILRGDVISYYKTKSDDFTVGSIPLNSLCSVIPPDENAMAKNDWSFVLNSRRKSFVLTCKTQADCNRWINAIQVPRSLADRHTQKLTFFPFFFFLFFEQDVIDNSPVADTQYEKLVDDLKMASPSEVETIFSTHKILTFSLDPLRNPLVRFFSFFFFFIFLF
jgi:myosin X